MRGFSYIFNAILGIALILSSPVFSAEVTEEVIKIVSGTLIKVDVKKKVIWVTENSRIVKFNVAADICEKFKGKEGVEVDITYKKENNKKLKLITIVISEVQIDNDSLVKKMKAGVNDNQKKK